MKLAYNPEHEALRQELRACYQQLITPEVREEVRRREAGAPILRRVVRQMGADGWLGISWPKAYGGRGMTPIEQFIFFDASMPAGAPVMPPCTFMAAWASTSTTRSTAASCGSNK